MHVYRSLTDSSSAAWRDAGAHLTGPQVSRTATNCSMKSFSSCLYATPTPISTASPACDATPEMLTRDRLADARICTSA